MDYQSGSKHPHSKGSADHCPRSNLSHRWIRPGFALGTRRASASMFRIAVILIRNL
jgi:hypothetical protein